MKGKQKGSGVDRGYTTTTNSRDMNYGAGNGTQCEADAADVQSTQCTAGCV